MSTDRCRSCWSSVAYNCHADDDASLFGVDVEPINYYRAAMIAVPFPIIPPLDPNGIQNFYRHAQK